MFHVLTFLKKSEGVKELRARVCRQLYGKIEPKTPMNSLANKQWRCCLQTRELEYLTNGETDDVVNLENAMEDDTMMAEEEESSLLWRRLKEKFKTNFLEGRMKTVNEKMGR